MDPKTKSYQEQAFSNLNEHLKIIEIKDSQGDIVLEIFPVGSYKKFVDKDFERRFLTRLDPEHDDHLFMTILNQLSYTENIIKKRRTGKHHLIWYLLTGRVCQRILTMINLLLSIIPALVILRGKTVRIWG